MKKIIATALFVCAFAGSQLFAQQIITREQAEQIAKSKTGVEPLRLERGFQLIVFTPTTWVGQAVGKVGKDFVADVSMLEPIIRVYASPNLETNINTLCESVKKVILKDETKSTLIQAIHEDPFTQASFSQQVPHELNEPRSACNGVIAHFSIEQVRQIHGGDGDQEFFITVIGDSSEQDFRVTRDDFAHLP